MLTFIVNPSAGGGYALRVEKMIQEEMEKRRLPFSILHTKAPHHATELAREASSLADCTGIVSVGGDGTAYEVACGLMHQTIPFGIIPAGTGNDFIKTVKIPKDPKAALEKILTGTPRPLDFGQINDRRFLNVCGTGFDVQVLDEAAKVKSISRGLLPYLIGLLRAISHYHPVHVRLQVDGREIEQDALVCTVANGRFIGGGIPICPVAEPDDGLLDVVFVDNLPKWKIVMHLPALMRGTILRKKAAHHFRCKSVVVDSPGMRLNVDGEIFPMDRAAFSVQPAALLLYW